MKSFAADWRIDVRGAQTSAIYEPPTGARKATFVCAHGAGGNMRDRGMQRTAHAMREAGLGVVRFNFLYSERRSGRPDPMPRLQECITAVVARARDELGAGEPFVIGGRSMGGRAASMLAAEGFQANGLLLLAYPLHPAGRPDQLRDAHLPAIRMPVLCINGTRDALCTQELMAAALRAVRTSWTMHWVENADHSFRVPRSSGRTDEDVLAELSRATRDWLRGIVQE